jgi:hypothetical protein
VRLVPESIEFFGEQFALSDSVSEFALLEFAEAASDGQDGDTMEGLASMLRLIKECVARDAVLDEQGVVITHGLDRFLSLARRNRAGAKDLIPVLQVVFGAKTERPTGRPSDLSDGPDVTGSSSMPSADVKVANRFDGRPDLRLALSRVA